jgi:catechol 2,3-dioxygenase-like lactoylglutathione lyase family enzyme
MKIKSVSGLVLYVEDVAKTTAFYESLGFRIGEQNETDAKVYMNWYSIAFRAQTAENKEEFKKEAKSTPRGSGIFICVNVDDVDEFYTGVIDKGMKPSSEPRDWPWGNREFVLRDPDGYKLVFFQKK